MIKLIHCREFCISSSKRAIINKQVKRKNKFLYMIVLCGGPDIAVCINHLCIVDDKVCCCNWLNSLRSTYLTDHKELMIHN